MSYLVSIDAESLGLYGQIFAVGAVVYENNIEIKSFYAGCDISEHHDHPSYEWLNHNVIPHLPAPTHRNKQDVIDAFWEFYQECRSLPNVKFISDCGTPVEAFLFRTAVNNKLQSRIFSAPYPLHELGTLLFATGQEPIGVYSRLENELPAHNPVNDARQSGRLWIECCQKLKI